MSKPWIQEAWLCLSKEDLRIERRQAEEEGRDLLSLTAEFEALQAKDPDRDPAWLPRATALLERVQRRPLRADYSYDEPDLLDAIRGRRPPKGPEIRPPVLEDDAFFDRIYGAWLGRCCGCLAGKPVEGRSRRSMERILEAQGRRPLNHYWSMKVDPAVAKAENWFPDPASRPSNSVIEGLHGMPEDDDTNYTVAGYAILDAYGGDFTSCHVGRFWLAHLPILHVFTAERAAYRNLVRMLPPPGALDQEPGAFTSANWCNPYREWIGAQIRADFYGYAAFGRPEAAAAWAWRDACISHVKNGIYGAMWVAAMLAAAWSRSDPKEVIEAGLAQIPKRCRLSETIRQVLAWSAQGLEYGEAADRIHRTWDETDFHDWCHVIPNAAIVAVGLLWGGRDFEQSICRAVMCACDTDCNGATVGSIVGLILGAQQLPQKWTAPLEDTLRTGIQGKHELKLSELAKASCALAKRL